MNFVKLKCTHPSFENFPELFVNFDLVARMIRVKNSNQHHTSIIFSGLQGSQCIICDETPEQILELLRSPL
jgi:hypothetical protein